MDLKELTQEMNRFVSSKGWYEPESPRPQTPKNLAISLSLESAEVLEHFNGTRRHQIRRSWRVNWLMSPCTCSSSPAFVPLTLKALC